MPEKPDRLYIDQSDVQRYDDLEKCVRMFGKRQKKELFLTAMAIGWKNEARIPINKKQEFVRMEYLRPEDEALIYAVAISAGSVDILVDPLKVYQIAEEYAHGGITLLIAKINQPGSFEKNFEKELLENYQSLFR
jgi:hypothetical protein